MAARANKITALSAAVRVNELGKNDKPKLRQTGWSEAGKPVLEPQTKLIFLSRGDELPKNLADGEKERLEAQGALGTDADLDALENRMRGIEPAPDAPADAPPAVSVDHDTLAGMNDADLAKWVESEKPKVADLVAAVGDDADLAGRVLAAESAATKGDPRSTLKSALDKVVSAAEEARKAAGEGGGAGQ